MRTPLPGLPAGFATREQKPGRFWPVDRKTFPFPTIWRRDYHPCPSCERILDDGKPPRQAVVCGGRPAGIAYLMCRVCGHKWTLPAYQAPGEE